MSTSYLKNSEIYLMERQKCIDRIKRGLSWYPGCEEWVKRVEMEGHSGIEK